MCQMVMSSDSQSARPIRILWYKLWEDSICEWPLKQTDLASFCLIVILKLSHNVLGGLFSVLSTLHGCKHNCTFCRMKHHWAWCDYCQILLLEILSSMEPTNYLFSNTAKDVMATFRVLVNKYIFPQRQSCTALVLSANCTECCCSPNLVGNF